MKFYNMEQGENAADVYIHSQIGIDWFGEGVDSQGFIDDINDLGEVETINLHINSPGGNVNDGIAIYNHLKQHSARVVTTVDGSAASIASVIAMAGDEINMPLGSSMFVHDPLTWVMGNSDEMRYTADMLDKTKESIVDIYVDRTGMSRDEIGSLMNAETLLTAKEAVDMGFADNAGKNKKPVMNTFDVDAMKAQVQMHAEMTIKDSRIDKLNEKLTERDEVIVNLKAEIEGMKKEPEIANAKDVIAACKEGGIEVMAARFIEQELEMPDIENRIKNISDVLDICKASGIQNLDAVATASDDSVQLVRTVLNEYGVALEEQGSNQLTPDGSNEPEGKLPSVGEIYAKRKFN